MSAPAAKRARTDSADVCVVAAVDSNLPHFVSMCTAPTKPCPRCFCFVCDVPAGSCGLWESHALVDCTSKVGMLQRRIRRVMKRFSSVPGVEKIVLREAAVTLLEQAYSVNPRATSICGDRLCELISCTDKRTFEQVDPVLKGLPLPGNRGHGQMQHIKQAFRRCMLYEGLELTKPVDVNLSAATGVVAGRMQPSDLIELAVRLVCHELANMRAPRKAVFCAVPVPLLGKLRVALSAASVAVVAARSSASKTIDQAAVLFPYINRRPKPLPEDHRFGGGIVITVDASVDKVMPLFNAHVAGRKHRLSTIGWHGPSINAWQPAPRDRLEVIRLPPRTSPGALASMLKRHGRSVAAVFIASHQNTELVDIGYGLRDDRVVWPVGKVTTMTGTGEADYTKLSRFEALAAMPSPHLRILEIQHGGITQCAQVEALIFVYDQTEVYGNNLVNAVTMAYNLSASVVYFSGL